MNPKKKNVLMICCDHWFADLMGCAGRHDIMTPTLDYLAEHGVRFDNCYSECPVCIPARRTMMTGLLPATHGDRVYSDRMPMPQVATLPQVFRDNGYQAYAVGKLHVFPQRDRIGFDDVILAEEGRYEFGVVDDYQAWLGENGYVGQEFMHGMGNNNYLTRPWHLDERAHPTTWVTTQMMKTIKRLNPTRPAFLYCSYAFPHPPLVPLQQFWDMYDDAELCAPTGQDWLDDRYVFQALREPEIDYSEKEKRRARRAFYAQCTHIDYSIRSLIGTLRECNMLDNTILVFLSDHGDMLFDHDMVAKRCFYEQSAKIPLIFTGKPVVDMAGTVRHDLAEMADVMPTILQMCGLPIPSTVEGKALFDASLPARDFLFGEIGEDKKATRMVRRGDYKFIYYPCGNVKQLFDLKNDPTESHDLAGDAAYAALLAELEALMIPQLHGMDLDWVHDGRLVGYPAPEYRPTPNYGLYNQRGYHWPPPTQC